MENIRIESFYPASLRIIVVEETENRITIKMKSMKHEEECQQCKEKMGQYHGTYVRRVQDLPILGKQVILEITSYEYKCTSAKCNRKTFVDEYDGFLSRYSRMTRRCEEFVKILAMETSCAGASLICGCMGIRLSGDTIIRMLKAMADESPAPECGEVIGVDDFAYRKGQTYCTIVCDWETRRPVAVLEGRDGESLREWLKGNKHVKKVTRDRASAYAKVISEELPDAMQIADRFHLHHNLLRAVKETLKAELPNKVAIPNALSETIQGVDIEQTANEQREKTEENKKNS